MNNLEAANQIFNEEYWINDPVTRFILLLAKAGNQEALRYVNAWDVRAFWDTDLMGGQGGEFEKRVLGRWAR